MKISLCIPSHDNRWIWTGQTVANLHNDPRIDEIIIVDDASNKRVQDNLQIETFKYPKVKLFLETERRLVFKNKLLAVERCNNNIVALLDSDNIFNIDYLDAFEKSYDERISIFCPEKSLPRHNFSRYTNIEITKSNVSTFMDDGLFVVLMNTGNYILNKERYLPIITSITEESPNCADVIFMNYYLLMGELILKIVPGMEYNHVVHDESTYFKWCEKEPGATRMWQNKLKNCLKNEQEEDVVSIQKIKKQFQGTRQYYIKGNA